MSIMCGEYLKKSPGIFGISRLKSALRGFYMLRNRKLIGLLVLLPILLISLWLFYVHMVPMSIKSTNVKIAKLDEAMKHVKSDYNIRKVTVEYHRSGHVYLNLYTNQVFSDITAKDLLKECAKAITDPETLASIKEAYVDRVGLDEERSWYYEVNPHLFDQDGYQYFDISIGIIKNSKKQFFLESHGKENYANWYYRNNTTGETHVLTLSH